jgi:hypothetical protein
MSDWEIASEAPAPKAEGNAWEIASEAPAPHEKGFMDKIADFLNPRYKSVLEGRNMGIPDAVDPQKNLEAALRSEDPNTINDIMHSSGRAQQMVEQGKKIFAEQEADEKAKREKLRKDAAKEEYGIGTEAKDIGLSAIKSVPQVAGAALGLGELATGWMPTGKENNPLHIADWKGLHEKLQENGVSPTQVNEFLAGFQSKTLRNQRQNVQDAPDGIWEAAKTYGVNPAAMVNDLVENLPGMVTSGFAGGKVANALYSRAIAEAGKAGLKGAEAAAYATNKVGGAFTKAAAVATGEGAYESSNLANMASENGADWNNYILPALASGVATTAISTVTGGLGTKFGVGDIESSFARRAMNKDLQQGAAKGFGIGQGAKNFIFEPLKESAEEALQAAPQQIAQNLALGKPWDEGVAQNVGQSAVAGLGMSGAHIAGSKALEKISSPELGTVTPFGTVTPIYGGPTNAELDEIAKNLNVPEDQYEQFRNAVRNEIDRRKQQEYEKAQTGEPIVVSPLRQPLTSPAQGEMFQQGPKDTNTAPEYKTQEQLNLPSEITDEESGEVHALNPQQQVELQGLVHRYITNGIEPNRALAMAQTRVLAGIREQGQVLDQEEPNATRPNPQAAGAGVPTSQQPAGQIAPTQGAQGAQPNGVVPNQPNAPVPITGEGQQPAPVSLPVQTTAPTPTVNVPVPQQNKPAIEPLPKDEFNERIDNLKEALRPYEHLEHGQMTPGQQQQFKNINAEILRLGLNQGLTRAEIHDLTYGKPEQKQANTWVPPEVKATTPTPTKAVQEQEAQPTRDMSEPIKAPEGDMSVEELRDNNEFSDQIEPEFHAHVADSAAIIDNPKAAVEAAKKERDAARMSFQNIESLYKNPDIEAQATKEQVDEARKDLEDAQAKLDAVEQKAKEITETQKQAGRQRAEGGGRKKQELTPEQEAAKVKLDEEAKARKRADTKARTTIKKAVEQLEVGHMPLTDAELDDPQGKAVHEMYKESLIEEAALALQGIVENKILNGTKIQKAAKELLAQYDITKADIEKIRAIKENANKGLEDQLNRKPDLFKGQNTYKGLLSSSSTAPSVGKAIPAFNDAFTANAAITVIMKNGTAVEKYFANHIRGYVRDVNFVVIEKGDKLPVQLQKYEKAWNESRGLFIPESTDNNTPRTIYVRGSSFGENRGNDITTVLHELLHAAGMERLIVGVKNIDKDTKLTRAILDIASIRERARTIYEDMIKRKVQSEDFKKLKTLIDDVPIILFDDELTEGIAQGLDEFLAYSLSQDEMKTFLQAMPANGRHFTDSMFSRFVRGFMDALGIDSGKPAWRSGMTDLVLATNKLLTARYSSVESKLAGEVRKSIQRSGPPDKETRIELTKLIAELKGAKTDAQKIAYFENEKKRLSIELAKEDAGKYNEEWGMGIGRGSGTSAQGIKNRRVNAAYAVADLQNHYDDVIHSLENKSPVRSSAIRKAKIQEEKVTRGLEAARISKNGPELGGATQNLQKERDPRNYVDQIVSIGSDPLNKLIASTWDVDALGRNGARLGLPGLKDVYKNMQLMNGTTQKKLIAVANEIEALQNFFWDNPDKKEKFTELVTASTFDRYDPSNPKGKYNPAYDAIYKELGDAGQKAYKRLKEFYRDLNDEKQQLLKEQIDKLDLEPEERKKVAAALREAYEGSDKIDPYFPLMRFGDFVLDLGSGSNKISYRFESAHQRDKAAAILANKIGKSIEQLEQDGDMLRKNDVNSSQMRSSVMNSSKLLKAISEAVNSTPSLGNAKYKDELMDKVYQTYLSFMPEQSVRKQFMHRKDIPGFSTDLIRVLGAHGVRAARQVARLQHGQDIRNSLGIVERQLKGNPGATPYYNKMSNYVDLMLNPPVRSGGYKALETTSSWLAAATHFHTLTSWASAFVQPVDIFSRAFPIIGAEYGYANTSAEMARMMKITSKYGVIEKLPDGTERWRMPSVSFANGLTEDEKFAIKAMEDSGVVKETMASTAYEGANGKYIDSKNWYRIKPTVNNLVMGGLMAHTERLSRELSYMAAFNAGMKFLKKTNPKMPHTEMRRLAADKAISKTFEAFGNYADYSKPGFFRHPITRLALMFKFYPYVLYKTMIGNMVKALPLLKNKGEKAQAMKKVFGIMGVHFLLGGLNATPGFSLAMMAAAAAFKVFGKDPDAPDDMRDVDFETWFRTVYLPEHLGHTGLDKLIEYGPLGAGFSNRISINNMLSFGDKPNESLLQTALDGFNAVPGAIKNYYDGGHALINGEYEKGFEKLLPGSLSSILTAGRIVEEGLRTSNGDQIEGFEKGNVPASTIAAQAVGFRPGEVINQQNKDFKMMNTERVVELERAQLSAKLKDAFIKSMDTDKGPAYTERFDKQFEEILDKMGEFGERHPEIAFDNPKDPKEINGMLEQALQDKLNREANAGVKLTDKNIRIFGDAVDYMKEQQTKK